MRATIIVSSNSECSGTGLTLQMPQATVHSSLVADAWFAWHSMQRSMMWLRQMAQLSTTMSHAQRATAFHCDLLALPRHLSRRVCTHLLDFEALLVAVSAGSSLGHLRLRWGRIGHIDVSHVCGVCRVRRGVRGVDGSY
jgi:hypothetical protein